MNDVVVKAQKGGLCGWNLVNKGKGGLRCPQEIGRGQILQKAVQGRRSEGQKGIPWSNKLRHHWLTKVKLSPYGTFQSLYM